MHRLPAQKGLLRLGELEWVLLWLSVSVCQMLLVVGLPKTIQRLFVLIRLVVMPGVQILG
jgi:hypothetical protein